MLVCVLPPQGAIPGVLTSRGNKMAHTALDEIFFRNTSIDPREASAANASQSADVDPDKAGLPRLDATGTRAPRKTPRKSVILVLPDNHVVSPERLAEQMPIADEREQIDVIVACAGQPTNLSALQRKVRDLQVLLAPVGTSNEDLRELAMKPAPGDIVTLLSGALPIAGISREQELFLTR